MKSRIDVMNEIKNIPAEKQLEYLKNCATECHNMGYYTSWASYLEVILYNFNGDFLQYLPLLASAYNSMKLYKKTVKLISPYMDNTRPEARQLYLLITPFYHVGVAYHNLQEDELAISFLNAAIEAGEDSIKANPNAGDIGTRKAVVALSYAEKGAILYDQEKYIDAFAAFSKSYKTAVSPCTIYYLSKMFYLGQAVDKDVAAAQNMLSIITELKISEKSELFVYVCKAHYDLGLIYATEPGYINKEKAIEEFNKAKELGYEVTDKQINYLIANI